MLKCGKVQKICGPADDSNAGERVCHCLSLLSKAFAPSPPQRLLAATWFPKYRLKSPGSFERLPTLYSLSVFAETVTRPTLPSPSLLPLCSSHQQLCPANAPTLAATSTVASCPKDSYPSVIHFAGPFNYCSRPSTFVSFTTWPPPPPLRLVGLCLVHSIATAPSRHQPPQLPSLADYNNYHSPSKHFLHIQIIIRIDPKNTLRLHSRRFRSCSSIGDSSDGLVTI